MAFSKPVPPGASMREFLSIVDPELGTAADRTWDIACCIHDRQTKKDDNVNGRRHVEQVEKNIWKLITRTADINTGAPNLDKFEPRELYILSCAACCHDFDKGLANAVLDKEFKHGEGSGKFVSDNRDGLSIRGQGMAEYVDWIVSLHGCKEDFYERLENLPDGAGWPPLRLLATLLKAADTLHMDESRISELAVPSASLAGLDRAKQLARGATLDWGIDGRRIVFAVLGRNDETAAALRDSQKYILDTEWPPIGRALHEYRFPYRLSFEWATPPHRSPEPPAQIPELESDLSTLFEVKTSEAGILRPEFPTGLASDKLLSLVAVRPEDLGVYLCEMGPLTVIGNKYIEPVLHEIDSKPAAPSRLFIGPANCGKTRAAFEWIMKTVGSKTGDWVIVRPESGSVPRDAGQFKIDWASRYGSRRRRPKRVILFVDDLPDFLPRSGTEPAASEAVHRLFGWFRSQAGFQERCFVGTMRTEKITDKPGWPDTILTLGGHLQINRIEPLSKKRLHDLWEGMKSAKSDISGEVQELNLCLTKDFVQAVSKRSVDPEAVAYFVRAMVNGGARRLTKRDAKRFFSDVTSIWTKETWPVVQNTYGSVASVFFTISRFIEAGAQPKSRFAGSLAPWWEYHAVYGPKLLNRIHGSPDDYLPGIERMLQDGHATGVIGDWIRPSFDFLLQAPSLDKATIALPPVDWFAAYARELSPEGQTWLSLHFSLGDECSTRPDLTPAWLLGYAFSRGLLAKKDRKRTKSLWQEELDAYARLVTRFGRDKAPEVRQLVAVALLNTGQTLSRLKRYDEAVATCVDLVKRFGNDTSPEVRNCVVIGLFDKAEALERLKRDKEEATAYKELIRRFGHDRLLETRAYVAGALLNMGVTLGRLKRDDEAVAAYVELHKRFGNDKSPVPRMCLAMGLFNKAKSLERLKRDDEAVAAYDELIRQFGDDSTPVLRKQVVQGLFDKGVLLKELKRYEEALAAFDQLLKRSADDKSLIMRDKAAAALLGKAAIHFHLEHHKEALVSCSALVSRFGDDSVPGLRQLVAHGLLLKGAVLEDRGQQTDAVAAYDDLARRFSDDTTSTVYDAVGIGLRMETAALCLCWRHTRKTQLLARAIAVGREAVARGQDEYNLACALVLAGDADEAFQLLERCLEHGGIAWTHVEDDIDWSDVRTDRRYQELRAKYARPRLSGKADLKH